MKLYSIVSLLTFGAISQVADSQRQFLKGRDLIRGMHNNNENSIGRILKKKKKDDDVTGDNDPKTKAGKKKAKAKKGKDPNIAVIGDFVEECNPTKRRRELGKDRYLSQSGLTCDHSCNKGYYDNDETGEEACDATTLASIAPGSCNGDMACFKTDGEIGQQSCNGYHSCQNMNGYVGHGSCIAESACDFEEFSDSSISVGDYSCLGYQSCLESNATMIGDRSCVGTYACYESANANIGDSSCFGAEACDFVNYADIGQGSCLGAYACYYIGVKLAEDKITIGERSCIGNSACEEIDVNVGDGSCTCDECCSCTDPKGTGVVGDGECTSPGECCL